MRDIKVLAGQLVVPALALIYAIHALWELNDGSYQRVTIIYTTVIVIPMLILGAVAVGGDFLRWRRGERAAGTPKPEDEHVGIPGGTRRLVLFIGASFALVLALDYIGYLVGFFVYVCFVLWALEYRRVVPVLGIALAVTAMVHFVFAGLLGQDLPLGFMTGWLGE